MVNAFGAFDDLTRLDLRFDGFLAKTTWSSDIENLFGEHHCETERPAQATQPYFASGSRFLENSCFDSDFR